MVGMLARAHPAQETSSREGGAPDRLERADPLNSKAWCSWMGSCPGNGAAAGGVRHMRLLKNQLRFPKAWETKWSGGPPIKQSNPE